jgi:hypothetical protein
MIIYCKSMTNAIIVLFYDNMYQKVLLNMPRNKKCHFNPIGEMTS